MATENTKGKRKAAQRDVDESEDESLDGLLDGVLSESEDEALEGSSAGEDEIDQDTETSEAESDDQDAEALSSKDTPSGVNRTAGDEDGAQAEEDGDVPNYRVTTDANGGVRYEYDEIDPVYDSDDTDAQGPVNTIGNIPLSFYDSYPHIGYDINGKKIMRPAAGEALDALLDSIELPKGWTGLTDPSTGKPLNLTQEELELLRRVQQQEIPEEGYDPYPDMVEYFTSIEEKMPLSSAPEPKRRFVPSKHEQKRVMKLVRAIREGRILPYKPPEEREKEEEEKEETHYDLWHDEVPTEPHIMHIPAPKLPPPGHDASYNVPAEYVPTKEEKEAWENTDPEEREKEYLPQKYDSLRKVPGYEMFVKERFERCLDLYLAPRVRKNRLNIDPNSLLPKLPRPEELKPFPTVAQTIFRGHEGWVRSLAIDPTGCWLASGGNDSTVRVWELLTGRQVWKAKLSTDEPVRSVRWRPTKDAFVLAAAAAEDVFLMVPPVVDPELEQASRDVLDAGFGYATNGTQKPADAKQPAAKWARPSSRLEAEGVLVQFTVRSPVATLSWHRRGDHLCTVSPAGGRASVAIHTLSRHLTQVPFRKMSNMPQTAHFHPTRPLLFLATKQAIRCYDLQKMELAKTIQPGARLISSFDVHGGGDHLIVGSYDRRLLWHDLELSSRPYRTMRFHDKATRAVKYHKGGLPLFADASDDGTLQVFHCKVVADLMENPTIVPLKVLRGHAVVESVGILDLDWHPTAPWCVSAGADGTCRLWM